MISGIGVVKPMMDRQPMVTIKRSLQRVELKFGLILLFLLGLTAVLYWPGWSGPLLMDDNWNLKPLGDNGGVRNLDTFLQFVFGNTSGPSGRPVAMLSFLIDAQDWPPSVAALKYTNTMIHLLCGLVICWMTWLMSNALALSKSHSIYLALFVAGVWLLHPLNATTTLYVIQRMTQLMTLFAVAALICYLSGRQLIHSKPNRAMIYLCLALFPFGLLSVLSKENGALLLLLIVFMELTVFRSLPASRWFSYWYRAGVVVPLLIVVAYLLVSLPENLALYEIRHYNLIERLLTESRIVVFYLFKILIPNALGVGLFHDDIVVSTGLLRPVTTLFSLLFLMALVASAIRYRKTQPVYALAVFWFLGMHILESSYIPLELYFEHRNYMAMIGPLYALAWYLRVLLLSSATPFLKQVIKVTVSIILLISTWLTWQLADLWGNAGNLHAHWALEKPTSIRAQLSYADYLAIVDEPEAAMEHLQVAHQHYPEEVTILLYMWNLACEHGLQAPYSIEQIASYDDLEFYRDDINHHIRILMENLSKRKCEYPPQETMVSLFARLGEFPLPDFRRAVFYFYYSDLFVYYGQLNPALINLTRAFEAKPVPQIPIRQAILSASAGNFSDALVFLDRARLADAAQSPLLPSTQAEIDRLQQDFTRILGTN